MTNKEKGNILIAEFMGINPDHLNTGEGWDYDWKNCPEGLHWPCEEAPPFDSNWRWLMPALKMAKHKIKEAGWGTPTETAANKRLGAALNELYNLNIENVHFCLVKFITWYNDQKP